MYIHTKEKPYRCTDCHKGFSQSKSLAIHKILHNEAHSHKCPICKIPFGQRSNLKTHLLTHTEVKPKQMLEIAESLGSRLTCGSTKGRLDSRSLELEEDVVEPSIDVCSYEDIAEDTEVTEAKLENAKKVFRGFLIDQLIGK